ncbi:hypothetical protein YA0745_25465 [Pseudomonas synxantha]|uniref:Tc toxin complex TcA C-terminal TcB-binding domain-containing protein n=1 Tax=Pseudomonas synxantha TaxID=47883 RepID=A0ABS0UIF1_9PSED|nr:hypothetical protein [Pseudomonas synxantha]MBI6565377.1 hypothetical protein [Pseudomonas synxantha]MBI6581722.1 hypothetical protein [Pseudomonas synxantha]MBI6646276.1 hypothetical protein [Pseudomonas synxantha]
MAKIMKQMGKKFPGLFYGLPDLPYPIGPKHGPAPKPFPILPQLPQQYPPSDFKVLEELKNLFAEIEARRAEEERKKKAIAAKTNQLPGDSYALLEKAEQVRLTLDRLYDVSLGEFNKGRIDRAAVYGFGLAMVSCGALQVPLRLENDLDITWFENEISKEGANLSEFLDDSSLMIGNLTETIKYSHQALDTFYRVPAFKPWELVDAEATDTEKAFGLNKLLKEELWQAVMYHKWPEVSQLLNSGDTVFLLEIMPEDEQFCDGLVSLLDSICSVCLYVNHRVPSYVERARRALQDAKQRIPLEARRAMHAVQMQEEAITAIEGGAAATVGLPGNEKLYTTLIDPTSFSWSPLLLGDQNTVELDVNGASVNVDALYSMIADKDTLFKALPFELYDPRLALWLSIGVSSTWVATLAATYAIAESRYEVGDEFIAVAFQNMELLPASMRPAIERLAVTTLIELVRTWSESLYEQEKDVSEEDQPKLLNKVAEVIGRVTELVPGSTTLRVSATSFIATARIDPSWKESITKVLNLSSEAVAPGDLPPALVPALHEIRRRLRLVSAGELSSGKFLAVAPLWRFEYLYDAATFFVTQAKYTEERAQGYKDRASQDKLQRQQLQDAIDMANAESAIASKRVEEAQAGIRIAHDNMTLAETRKIGATERLAVYRENSELIRQNQAIAASLGGGSSGEFGTISNYIDSIRRTGEARGPAGFLIGAATYLAASYTGEIEETSLQAQVAEATEATSLAQSQIEAEEARKEIAEAYEQQAQLRLEAARKLLASYEADPSSVSYGELATFIRHVAEAYYRMAVDAAMAAQSAFNYQYRAKVELISPRPGYVVGLGIKASEELSLKLAQLRFFQLRLGNRRRTPVRWEVRLQNTFPEAMERLRETGSTDFTLSPQLLNNYFPGLYNVTVLQVRLRASVGGLIDQWVMTNSPKGLFRGVDGRSETLDQTVEARLNTYGNDDLPESILQARVAQNQLEPFENTSPFCTWSIRYMGRKAAVDMSRLTEIKVSFDLDAEYSNKLAEEDQSEGAQRLLNNEHIVATTLSVVDPESTAQLFKQGNAVFLVPFSVSREGRQESLFPEGAAAMQLTGLALRLLVRPGVTKSLDGIQIEVEVPCDPSGPNPTERLKLNTDATGAVDPATVHFENVALPLGRFDFTLLQNVDALLNDSGVKLDDLIDVAFVASYKVIALRSIS